ncbi:MAG: mannose-1-phosphate guanylyltransferase, partial [Phycisphaeraceae bacterium]|nr:mannose-1-phosphate guanylyltransferase [Phycisphaeraceae bacterium]
MLNENCYVVVMAGGIGTRLWPLSRKHKPKHFLRLFEGKCLIELTIEKLKDHIPNDRIIVLTSIDHKAIAQQTLTQIPPENFIYEPCVRDTTSAIGLAATVLKQRCDAPTMIMLTADQIIEPADRFNTAITNAVNFLESHPDRLVAFGVEATSPSTLVGWQNLGDALDVPDCEVRQIVEFTEKPDLNTAREYMSEGGYCWNSGQFAWKADAILKEIKSHVPEAPPLLEQIGDAWNTNSRDQVLNELFPKMPKGSIDYQVMQKTCNACSIFLPCSWEDMGTHVALADKIGTKHKTNLVSGKAIVTGTGNRILATTDQSVVVALDNVIVVVTDNTVFVGDPDTDMKALVESVGQKAPET